MGKITLERFNGREIFEFKKGYISVHQDDGRVSFVFSVYSDGSAVESLPDTAGLEAEPSAEAFVLIDKINLDLLKENTFYIPRCYDESIEEHLSTFYYVEHEDLDNNKIEIKHIKSNLYRVDWSGTTIDVNYYDGSKPDTKVFISGEFAFENMDKWQ